MKIVNVNKFYYLRGGAERAFFSLTDLLEQHGHEVIPFAMHHPANLQSKWSPYFVSYVEFGKDASTCSSQTQNSKLKTQNSIRAAARMIWSFEAARNFDRLLTDTKPDLIHIHNIYHQLSPSILPVAKRHGIPVVMTAHDYKLIWPDYLLCGYKKGGSPFRIIPRRCTQGSILKSAITACEWSLHNLLGVYRNNIDRIIVPSAYVHDIFIGAGISSNRLIVLPHPILPTSGKPVAKSKTPSLLFFGRLSKEKGVDILLRMMHNIKSPVSLRIAGTGPDEIRLKLEVERLKIHKNVTSLGQLDTSELRKEIQKAWVVVVPSRVPETFGLSVLEALAEGTPVIASNIGALPELVNGLGGGLLVRPNDAEQLATAVDNMITEIKRWNIEAHRAARTIKTSFSPNAYYKNLIDVYKQII